MYKAVLYVEGQLLLFIMALRYCMFFRMIILG